MCPIHWAPRSTFNRSALRARLSLMRMVLCAADTAGAATRPAKSRTTRNACMEASFPLRTSITTGRSLHHAHRGQPIDRGPVAELTVTIVAPAIGGARGRDPAGVRAAGAHRGEAHAARHEPRGPPPAGRGPVAELAFAVEAPAIGAARGRDPAAVDAAGAHRGEAHAARHEHRARPVSRGSVAELAPGVVAPAIGGARGRAPAGVAAGAHRRDSPAPRHDHRGPLPLHGALPALAVAVEAPAIGAARGRDPAGVVAARPHRGEAHAARHEHWGQPPNRGPVAELTVTIVAPAI